MELENLMLSVPSFTHTVLTEPFAIDLRRQNYHINSAPGIGTYVAYHDRNLAVALKKRLDIYLNLNLLGGCSFSNVCSHGGVLSMRFMPSMEWLAIDNDMINEKVL